MIRGGAGADAIRLRGRGPNTVDAGPGDDVVDALSRGSAQIDCGPGRDVLRVGSRLRFTRRGCERLVRY